MHNDRWLLLVHLIISVVGLIILSYQVHLTAQMLVHITELIKATH